ncbi:hypothetical protein [uncultured Methanofollis sp.]|uniref:hypothetical protein n=1 Tax=uncultured Methanofollis sp. TaxID=262500 RepID=UPI00260444E6|nr:hypothetical protein [uncultured Methanofollis sp.]
MLLQRAEFRVDFPGDRKNDCHFYDIPLLDDSQRREMVFWLEPEGPGTYTWTVSCKEGDSVAVKTGSLVLRRDERPCTPMTAVQEK